ncbi:hypothetical protein LTR37_004800 [Vermiconidia calcicola]|uniref:Uncharacterized protein n=1 Tax=Vermiconidia calcicola TaxID=1690605 RepID=A0ACC3NMF1_9PEZI|nr:hypothetical protein LTR37_004800 [Vermiconidia calcicola]
MLGAVRKEATARSFAVDQQILTAATRHETLTYECVCTDGSHPNISSYSATLPSYICEEYISQCVERAGDDLGLLTDCRSITCGTRNASSVAASNGGGSSGSASSASASASATSGSTGTGSGSAASATSEGAAIALSVAKSYGTGILAGGLLAVFGLAL